jgi:hypothetical protein
VRSNATESRGQGGQPFVEPLDQALVAKVVDLGFGRIVASELEAPIMLGHLVVDLGFGRIVASELEAPIMLEHLV